MNCLIRHWGRWAGALLAAYCGIGAAWASPSAESLQLQAPLTKIMAEVHDFHTYVLVIITMVCAFVLALLIWVMLFFNRRANPTPRKFTHNMTVEVIWTVVPVLILVAIAFKSFPLLFDQERPPPVQAELTLKVTGNSWNWSYEYPDLEVGFTSVPLTREDAEAQGRPYLLAVDNPLVVPEDTYVEVVVTSTDVIHSFAVPAFGIKEDAVQGRLNHTWFNVDPDMLGENRTVYGQCSELCGYNHSYMPIEIRVVTRSEFDEWVASQGGQSDLASRPSRSAQGHTARAEAAAR